MIGRSFVIMMTFLFSSCGATLSSTPQFPKVTMEGNRIVDPEYGYSLEIPENWVRLDETYVEKLDAGTRKMFIQAFDTLKSQGLRAWFIEQNRKASLQVFANGFPQKTKEEVIESMKDNFKTALMAENTKRRFQYAFDLQFDSFEELTDLNASYEDATHTRYVHYSSVYPFDNAEYMVNLAFSSNTVTFRSNLPVFYKCVRSLSLPGRIPTTVSPEARRNIAERLNALERLRDKGLISDEEYEKKRKQILDEL